jgi:guanylate kinase
MTADFSPPPRRGLMFVLSSPSGAGKSTLARELLAADPELEISVSVTTRARRPSEIHGRHYHFIDDETFRRMRDHEELLEWAEVHGNLYGTPRAAVERALVAGRDVLFDIDWQGTEQLSAIEALRSDLVRVFILPPTFRELRARLERRAEDAPETIRRRLTNALVEISKWENYDYVVINADLDRSLVAVRSILTAERVRRERVTGLAEFTSELLAEGRAAALAPEPVNQP